MVRRLLYAVIGGGLAVGVWFLADWLFDEGGQLFTAGRVLAIGLGSMAAIWLAGAIVAATRLHAHPLAPLAETPLATEPESFSARFLRFWREPLS